MGLCHAGTVGVILLGFNINVSVLIKICPTFALVHIVEFSSDGCNYSVKVLPSTVWFS